MDDLAVTPAWQVQAARKYFAGVAAFPRIALTIRPSHIVTITVVVRAIAVVIPIAPLVVVLLDSVRA